MTATSIEERFQLTGRRNQDALELARWVCLATRIEPFLLRRARLRFMPKTDAAVEADLWFSPLVEIRGSNSILLHTEAAHRLRAKLAENRVELNDAWGLTRKAHEHHPPLVRLEEEITWIALNNESHAREEIDEKLKPVVKALLEDGRMGVGRWAVTMLPRLPKLAQTTEVANLLLRASEIQLYNRFLNIDPAEGLVLSNELKALVIEGLERIKAGVRLFGRTLQISEPPQPGDEQIEIPATNPRVIELKWKETQKKREANLVWSAGGSSSIQNVSSPISIQTIAGQRYKVFSKLSVIRNLDTRVRRFMVELLNDNGNAAGTGWLVSDRYVLTGEHSFRRATGRTTRAGDFQDREVRLRFPLLQDNPMLKARVSKVSSEASYALEIKDMEQLLLLELVNPLPQNAHAATVKYVEIAPESVFFGFGHVPERWTRFKRQPSSALDGNYELYPLNERDYATIETWSGSPLVNRAGGSVAGMYRLAYVNDESRPFFVPIHKLITLFPEAFVPSSATKAKGVFIFYSHQDQMWTDRLTPYLRDLQEIGTLTLWDDRQMLRGENWRRKIQEAINNAGVAVFLISADFLASTLFSFSEELIRLLQRREQEGLRLYLIIVSPCGWQKVPWLSRTHISPRGGQPLSSYSNRQRDEILSGIATDILVQFKRAQSELTATPAGTLESLKVSLTRLPVTGRDLFGRERVLKILDDAWANQKTHIVSLVAWGGVGKSALVNHWLGRMASGDYRGAQRVYGWSFYNQSWTDHSVSADQFINAALRFFGDADPNQGSPWDKGERLAHLVAAQRSLLVLDGLEPLQYPPGRDEGRLKDQALLALLRQLAAHNKGLCIISTRVAVTDLISFEGSTAMHIDLEHLSPEAGAQVLRAQGVRGTQAELEQAASEFDGHALALTLLGSYLKDVYDGDVGRRAEITDLESDARYGRHAQRIMDSYEKWLGKGPELAVLRMLGLFNRPADKDAVEALRAAPVIKGLTDTIRPLKERRWQQVLAKLRRAGLLAAPSHNQPDTLDTHPLVREHFAQQLKREHPTAWQAANYRLYEHLKNTTKEFPETLEEIAPLYAAVTHACQAGSPQEALDEVYLRRIQRKDSYFSHKVLGAFGLDLATLAAFFDTPWRQIIPGLDEYSKSFLLNVVGYDLRALGNLKEAVEPVHASLEIGLEQKNWSHASTAASNLSTLYLTIGAISEALDYAHKSVEWADQSGDRFKQVSHRTALAHTLHQAGQLSEAEATFQEAEKMQAEVQPTLPLLISLSGFQYGELLLDKGKYDEVHTRAAHTLELVVKQGWLLDIALNHLLLGRAFLLQVQTAAGDFNQATHHLNQAVVGLRQAGTLDFLPLGLLARAELNRDRGDFNRVLADLDEANGISRRGGMGLHKADCHLEYARLYIAQGLKEMARESWEQAREMIERMSYHRRDKDVEEIESMLRDDLIFQTTRHQVLIISSHKDQKWAERLQTYLFTLGSNKVVTVWNDAHYLPAIKWKEEFERVLAVARVVVLLVSPALLASVFIAQNELPPLLVSAQKEGLRVFWVAVKSSFYEETEIGKYPALNDPSKPVNKLTIAERNEELAKICEQIEREASL